MKQSSKAPGKPCAQYFSETVPRFVCKIAPKTGNVFSGFMFMVSGKCLSSRFGVSLWGLLFPNCLASFGWAGSEHRFQVCTAYTDFHLQPIGGVSDKLKSSNHQISEGHHICPSVINNVSIAAASCPWLCFMKIALMYCPNIYRSTWLCIPSNTVAGDHENSSFTFHAHRHFGHREL